MIGNLRQRFEARHAWKHRRQTVNEERLSVSGEVERLGDAWQRRAPSAVNDTTHCGVELKRADKSGLSAYHSQRREVLLWIALAEAMCLDSYVAVKYPGSICVDQL